MKTPGNELSAQVISLTNTVDDMEEKDGWQLFPMPAKREKKTSFDKRIFCQRSSDFLRSGKLSSIQEVISALEVRQDEISHRLSADDLRNVAGKIFCGIDRVTKHIPANRIYGIMEYHPQVMFR